MKIFFRRINMLYVEFYFDLIRFTKVITVTKRDTCMKKIAVGKLQFLKQKQDPRIKNFKYYSLKLVIETASCKKVITIIDTKLYSF